MILKANFYLKSGLIIDDVVEFMDEATDADVNETMDYIKENIKTAFKDNINGNISFGSTLLRLTDIVAVKFFRE